MAFLKSNRRSLAGALALLACAACGQVSDPADEQAPVQTGRSLGLMTSLPIHWSQGDAFAELADDTAHAHWARGALEARFILTALDKLDPTELAGLELLLLAQPRALTPEENVALDAWVAGGGKVLVFADPALVGDYPQPIGDPNRPLDTVLLSPILARWGLELTFDPAHSPELRRVRWDDIGLDIAAAGAWRRARDTAREDSRCAIAAENIVAVCEVGAGTVVAIADATLLEDPVGGPEAEPVLSALLDRLDLSTGEIAGEDRE